MPTEIVVAIVVALVIVLAAYAVAWFRGEAWPLGVLALIMVASFLTYLFKHVAVALVLGISFFVGILIAIGIIIWGIDQMVKEDLVDP